MESSNERRIRERSITRKKRIKKTRDATMMEGRIGKTGPKGPKARYAKLGVHDKSEFEKLFEVVEGPARDLHKYLTTGDAKRLGETSTGLERSLAYVMDDLVRDDQVFKEFWEKHKLDKYYYSLPMYISVPGDSSRRERILYKIKKTLVNLEGPRHRQDVGYLDRQIGCLNTIKYGKKEMRIYDFPYPVPTIDSPAELDDEWKRAIRHRWGGEEYYNQAAYQAADATHATIVDQIANEEAYRIEDRYQKYINKETGKFIGQEEFREIIMKEKLSWCYLDEQKRWVENVFYMDQDTTNPIKHVDLETMYDKFMDKVMGSNECCNRVCNRFTNSFKESCGIQGGRRKRTRRRRKKNRKKRTKKKARRKRRRKSSKRRRRRKR